MSAVRIDLRRDLPKARAAFCDLLKVRGECLYASPCVVGTMIPENRRQEFDELDIDTLGMKGTGIDDLLSAGLVRAPKSQHADLIRLQWAFDTPTGDRGNFEDIFAELEAKYLPLLNPKASPQ